jgi:hypothetical protein
LTKSCLYLKHVSSLQWAACSPKVTSHNRIPNTTQSIVKIQVHTAYQTVSQYMILQNP